MTELEKLAIVAESEFSDIALSANVIDSKLRVVLTDSSYIDFWWSLTLPGRFAYHWERRHVDGRIFRHDNAPHPQWQQLSSFPRHFHSGSDENILPSDMTDEREPSVRRFLGFARQVLTKASSR